MTNGLRPVRSFSRRASPSGPHRVDRHSAKPGSDRLRILQAADPSNHAHRDLLQDILKLHLGRHMRHDHHRQPLAVLTPHNLQGLTITRDRPLSQEEQVLGHYLYLQSRFRSRSLHQFKEPPKTCNGHPSTPNYWTRHRTKCGNLFTASAIWMSDR